MSSTIAQAKQLVLSADLSPIEHKILIDDLIDRACDPELAAVEVLNRIKTTPGRPIEDALQELKHDWHELLETVAAPVGIDDSLRKLLAQRGGNRCCVTPENYNLIQAPEPSHIISPNLLRIWDSASSSTLLPLLDAFLTPANSLRIRKTLLATSSAAKLSNHLLLSPSIGYGLRNGHVKLFPLPTRDWNEVDVADGPKLSTAQYFLALVGPEVYTDIWLANGTRVIDDRRANRLSLHTEDPNGLPLPSPFLLKTQCVFAHALRRFYVEERISGGLPPPQSPAFWGRSAQLFFRSVWLLLPTCLRTFCYPQMLRRGEEQDISPQVYRLPFGLYAKNYERSGDNEPVALKLLEEKAPSVPAPLLIDKFEDIDGKKWLIMTRLPGLRVYDVLYRMTYPERHRLANDLSRVIQQLHRIPNTTPYLFANASGGRIYDRRAASSGCGPYQSEGDWNAQISKPWQQEFVKAIPHAFSKTHKSVFTHSDLFFSNVLIDGGRLSGIVDWECAGFLPEYWEFTKAMRAAVGDPDAQAIYNRIWGDQFQQELEVERWLWVVFPFGGPEE